MNLKLTEQIFYVVVFLEIFECAFRDEDGKDCWSKNGRGMCLPRQDCYSGEKTNVHSCGWNVCCSDPPVARLKCLEYKTEIFGEGEICNMTKHLRNRIIGGKTAAPLEFPHMAAIGFDNGTPGMIDWQCAGTIISPYFILTAAHCIIKPPDSIWILAGTTHLDDTSAQLRQVRQAFKHPKYRAFKNHHDLALLRVGFPFELNVSVVPACLLYEHEEKAVSKAFATGWGKLHEEADYMENALRKVEIDLIEVNECKRYHPTLVNFSGFGPSMLCAGHMPGGKDTCEGDSGGPLSVRMKNLSCIYGIIGTLSLGADCGWPNSPAIYTRVSYYLTWIVKVVWPNAHYYQ